MLRPPSQNLANQFCGSSIPGQVSSLAGSGLVLRSARGGVGSQGICPGSVSPAAFGAGGSWRRPSRGWSLCSIGPR